MTVLVGVLCQDGVIVGSDSSATFAGGNLRTIEQPVQKTFLVPPDVLFAVTGAGGLGQRLEFILQTLRQQTNNWLELSHIEIGIRVSRAMLQNMDTTFLRPGGLGALMAFACRDRFHLCEFGSTDFQPEMKTADAWFVTMGSGQMIADPFFGLLRRTLFRGTQPTLAQGILAACWALENAIHLNAGGINGPIQLGVLRRPNSQHPLESRLFGDNEKAEHRNAVEDVEGYLARYRELLDRPRIPPPPEPPSD